MKARLLIAALLLWAAPLAAQRPHRSGFWLELAGGPANVRVGCGGCDEVTRNTVASNTIRFGFPLSDHVMLGLEAFSFTNKGGFAFANSEDQTRTESGVLEAVLLWYPTKSGLFIKGGTGIASSDFFVAQEGADSATVSGTGVGLTVGLGYDFAISRKFAITANAGIHVAAIGDVLLPTGNVDDVIATVYSISVGVTLR